MGTQLPRTMAKRRQINDGKADMPDTPTLIRKSLRFAALKKAILAEQHALGLDIQIVNARTQALLGQALCETPPAIYSIIILARENELT